MSVEDYKSNLGSVTEEKFKSESSIFYSSKFFSIDGVLESFCFV